MIQQHARRNLLVAFILHLKLRDILDDRRIEIDFPLVGQLHGGNRSKHFTRRADPVHRVFRERLLSLLIIFAGLAGYDDAAMIDNGVLHAVRTVSFREETGLLLGSFPGCFVGDYSLVRGQVHFRR
ncbi:hypothetical protein D3C73_865310 [compost metagenome]